MTFIPYLAVTTSVFCIVIYTCTNIRLFNTYRYISFVTVFIALYNVKVGEHKSMLETLLIGIITGVIVAIVASLIIIRIYQRSLNNALIQQQAWERAQEERQQQWQHQQEKRAASLEKKLTTNVQQVQQEWHAWEHKDATRV